MKVFAWTLLLLVALIAYGFMQQQTRGNVERGKYLVEQVAMCGECHTPRDDSGQLRRSQWLLGAPVLVRNPYPSSSWANTAPRIAGLPQYTDAQALKLFTQGIARDGRRLRAPMPQFRFTRDDAEAVMAYLRSLR